MTPEPLFAAEPMDAPPRPTRSRTPVWLVSVAVIGLAAAGWTWLQRQPSFADITVSDLPPAVIANVPRPVAEGASAVMPLPSEPTAAGPEVAAASGVAPAASSAASAAVVAQAASAAVAPAPEPAAKPAPAKRTSPQPARVAKAAAPRVPPAEAPPGEPPPADAPRAEATEDEPAAKPEPAPAPARKPPPKTTAALPPEPATPRAACGTRSNFALVYCMQQQCKRWKFNNHPQCIEMERRGEL